MTTFPALKPTVRSLQLGQVAESSFTSLSGRRTHVLFADKATGHSLNLTFSNLLESEADLIVQHWNNRQGVALDFDLPVEVWAGWTLYITAIGVNQKWQYDQAPQLESVAPSIVSVTVQLQGVI